MSIMNYEIKEHGGFRKKKTVTRGYGTLRKRQEVWTNVIRQGKFSDSQMKHACVIFT